MPEKPDALAVLLEQVESMKNMLDASLTDSADVAELKTKMKYLWGNGKPGKVDEIETVTQGLIRSYWYMKGALWVIIGIITCFLVPLAIFLAEIYLARK